MASRYFACLWVADEFEENSVGPSSGIIVIDQDNEPQYTGLLDADGNRLFRVRERAPMGFCLNG
jgi:hypothetical protein